MKQFDSHFSKPPGHPRGFTYCLLVVALLWAFAGQAQTVSTLAGSSLGFVDGTGTAAQLSVPYGVAVDASGDLYVTNYHGIRKITPAGVVTTVAGSIDQGFAEGTGTAAQFQRPIGVAADASGNLYVTDYDNHRIRKIVIATGVVTTLAGSTPGFADGTGTAAQFYQPWGIAIDASGNLYVADDYNSRIRKIVIATGAVTTLAGSTPGSADGTGTAAQFTRPTAVAVDASGNLYVAELNNSRIRKIVIATGVVTTLAGSGTAGYADGTGTAAQFSQPAGLAVDASGNLYVVDTGNHRIRKIVIATGVVTTVAGSTSGYADGTGTAAQFSYPGGVAVDASGNLYVGDVNNNRIRKIEGVSNPPVVLTCPTNTTTAACQTQAAVNTAFSTWLATASGTGGCNGVLTNNNTGSPSACGGSTTITFTYTSSCAPLTTTCQATFTVPAAPTVVLICPTNTTTAACQTQAAVNTAFATWLASASGTGGCNGVLTNNNTGAPAACGGSTTVTFTYTSTCAPLTTTCQATFTVTAAPPVVLTCPANTTTAACQTQAAVNTAFATWLASASGTGGCNGVLTNNNAGAPSACGGSTTITFTYTSSCAPLTTTCQATFTVTAAPPVVLTCPTNTTAAANQTQSAVNTAFATWLATASASGGCNGVLTNNNTGAPSATGASTTVTFTYTSSCAPTTTTCQATFTVASAPPVVLTCPTNTTTAACQTQGAINAAFANWLATATGTGGCVAVAGNTIETLVVNSLVSSVTGLTNNNTGAPSACGGSTTVTFTYTSTCAPTTTTCQATFTVPAAPTVVLACPANTTTAACQTQAAVNTAFATWLASATGSGGCNGVLTNNNTGAPLATGGSKTVTFTYTSTCAPLTTTCQATFTVTPTPSPVLACPANITIANTAGLCGAVVNLNPTLTNNCADVIIVQTAGLPSGSTFPIGTTTNSFTITTGQTLAYSIEAGGTSPTTTCSFSVTVTDTEPPKITCPANISVCEGTLITYAPPVGTDNCMGAVTTQTAGLPSAMMYPVGITTNTFTVKAGNNQTASCAFTVTVQGKPTITLATQQMTLNEGNNQTLCDTDTNPVNGLQFTVGTGCTVGNPVWRTQIGAGAWSAWSSTIPTSQPSDNQAYNYQAACNPDCPTTFTNPISVTINYRAATPQNVSLVADGTTVNAGESKTICNTEGNTIAFNATCGAGETILYSVDGSNYTSVIPSQIADGNFHNYRVRCRKADGTPSCVETESAVMSLKITTPSAAPVVSITPTNGCGTPTAFAGNSSCGSLTTVWYNAATNQALPTLPTATPTQTTSYYARCQNTAGCLSEKSNVVTFTITPVSEAPLVTVSADLVCTGTEVTVSANCPAGTTALWNTGVTEVSFKVAFSNVTKATYSVKCVSANGCQSPVSAAKTVSWKAFELTFINVGQSKSATKSNDKAAWSSQFITPDAGPSLDYSTQGNPTIYFSENVNKTAPRFWTIQVETCNLGTDGSLTFNMLGTPELGVVRSYNTHENNAPYFMYANRAGFTELYAQNHPAYGFFADNGSGGNVYDEGLPKGLYKLGVRYWDQKGQGSIYPSTRQPAGNVLAYQEYWFRIQSKDGVGTGAARQFTVSSSQRSAARFTVEGQFAQVMPNPVSNTLHLKVNEAIGQKVNVNLLDASGRTLLQRAFTPESNQHQEEFEVSELANGMYFLKVNTAEKQATLKVIKIE